ncbi:MAG: UDP-N-acetylmuramoyl-L-alanyl-D-glutamate--2,6-diaminopimelate ligase, partial [Alphaproteobacteria bacterium]|nr:UDP-N-acetylmuramoyl-L-alanyl-D-glutamate--2,6-diaminopimelate ligase [Alphaproteobacteria bacterium]
MNLAALAENTALPPIEITGLSADSRQIEPGFLFAALPGTKADGSRFIDAAIEKGAAAILAPPGTALPSRETPLIEDRNPRRRLALMAARFYQGQPDIVVAVTGTNGKSSVVDFCRQLWQAAGYRAASMGTLGVIGDAALEGPGLTTPDPVAIHKALKALKEGGTEHLAMEASSHGLAQFRLDGVRIHAAGFTNLSRDHLDYHPTYDDYFHAKLRLFGDLLPPSGTAVINADSHVYEDIADVCWGRGIRLLSVGQRGDLALDRQTPRPDGQDLGVRFFGRRFDIRLPLIGSFQASNALIAAGLIIAAGEEPEDVFAALPALRPVAGRMELVGRTEDGAAVFVDYAHTPDALENVLRALRPHTEGQLVVVFGAGGDRDSGKRPLMGKVAASLADRAYVTDDNPRTEEASHIRR